MKTSHKLKFGFLSIAILSSLSLITGYDTNYVLAETSIIPSSSPTYSLDPNQTYVLNNKDLIKKPGSGTYLYQNNTKHLIFSTEIFDSYNYKEEDIKVIDALTFDSFPTGNYVAIKNGTLVKTSSDSTVYIIEGGKKRKISNPGDLLAQGYTPDKIKIISQVTLDLHPTGLDYFVSSTSSFESIISLVRASGTQIYLVKNNIKYPFVNSEIFDSYNYNYSNVQIVNQETLNSLPTGENILINSGTLIRSSLSPNIYIIEDGKKRKILDTAVFFRSGYKWNDIRIVSQATVDMHLNGPDFTDSNWQINGSLITAYGKIGKLENGTIRLFPDIETFLSHYRNWDLVKPVSNTVFNSIPKGDNMSKLTVQNLSDEEFVYFIINDNEKSSEFRNTDELRLIKTSSSEVHLVRDDKKYSFNSSDVFNSYNYKDGIIETTNQVTFDSIPTAGSMPFRGGSLIKENGSDILYIIDKNKKKRVDFPFDVNNERNLFNNFLVTGSMAFKDGILTRIREITTPTLFIINKSKEPQEVTFNYFINEIRNSNDFLNDENSFNQFLKTGSIPFQGGTLQRNEINKLFYTKNGIRTEVTEDYFEENMREPLSLRPLLGENISFDNILTKGGFIFFEGGRLERSKNDTLFLTQNGTETEVTFDYFRNNIRNSNAFLNSEESFNQFLVTGSLPFQGKTLRRLKESSKSDLPPLFFVRGEEKTLVTFDYFITEIRPRNINQFIQYGFNPSTAKVVDSNVFNLYPEGGFYRNIRYQPDGSLIYYNGKIAEIQAGKLREFSDTKSFLSYYRDCSTIRTVPKDVFDSIVKGNIIEAYLSPNNISDEDERSCIETINSNNNLP